MSVLEFIAALKWPVTVLILAGFIAYTLKRNPGTRASMGAWLSQRNVRVNLAGQQLEATLAETASSMGTAATSDEELAAAVRTALTPVSDPDLSQYPAPTPEQLGMLRRDAVEAVMRSAAEWGWDMARRGLQHLPELDVHWNDEGRPEIGMVVYEVRHTGAQDFFASTHREMLRRIATRPVHDPARDGAADTPQGQDQARREAILRQLFDGDQE